jgi:hypothetical protein
MERHCSGHHTSDDWRGTKVHQHIACRLQDVGLGQVQLQPTCRRDRAGSRNGPLLEGADHSEQSRTSGRRVRESAETPGFTNDEA